MLNLLPHSFCYNIREKNSRTQNAADLVYQHFMWPKLFFPFALANILKLKFVPKKSLVSVINLTVIALFSLYGLFSQCRHVTFPRELPSSFHNLLELSIKFRGKCSLGYHHVVCIGKSEIFKQMRSILIINYILKREIA